jgi:hypothetical protein
MSVTSQNITLLESVNILLAVQGESPVTAVTGSEPIVTQALETLYEVSRNIQAKGWWFNQPTGGPFDPTGNITILTSTSAGWHASLPHEFLYYVTIRASRVHQRRSLTSEGLEQFTAQEEAVAYATLQQVHVRNSGTAYDFNDFPAELKGLGVDEVLFLQGNVEEKIGTLKLATELAQIALLKAEELKTDGETALISAQELKTDQETALLVDQETELETRTAVELTPEQARFDNIATIDTFQDYPTELRMIGYIESAFYALPAWKKTEALKDAQKLRTARATVTAETADDLVMINRMLTMLSEAQVTACADNALASELWRALYSSDRELQNQDWFFNTEEAKTLTANAYDTYTVLDSANIISIDPDRYAARLRRPTTKESLHALVQSGQVDAGVVEITMNQLDTLNLKAGDWITIAGVEFVGFTGSENSYCNGTFQLIFVDSTEIHYDPSSPTSDSAGFVNQPEVDSLYVVSRRLYNSDENDWEWKGDFTASVRYRRALYDVPNAYKNFLEALTALRVAESYPDARFEIQKLGETLITSKKSFLDAEARQSDFNIFDNYDTAIIMGRRRPSFI